MKEFTNQNCKYPAISLENCRFDEMQVEAIYKFLLSLGVLKACRLGVTSDGRIYITKKFFYGTDNLPGGDIEELWGDQFYTLEHFLKLLVRVERSRYQKVKRTENRINQMFSLLEKYRKESIN